MTYREMLKKYKNGELDDETRRLVEQDIEKYEALSDFLFSEDDIKGFETNACTEEEKKFTGKLKDSIRKRFIKTGLIAGAAVLAIVITVIFGLPRIADSFFYNPTAKLETADGMELSTDCFTADFAAYSELFLPGRYRTVTDTERTGYGNYNISIIQNSSYTGRFRNINGRIERGTISFGDPRAFGLPASDSFDFNSAGVYCENNISNRGDYLLNNLELLSDNIPCMAYVTLDRVYTYEEFEELCKKGEIYPDWMALCRVSESANGYPYETDGIIGIKYADPCAVPYEFDRDEYPYQDYASMLESGKPIYAINDNIIKEHAVSVLEYLSNGSDFCKMMGINTNELEKMSRYISENGLHIYGFVVVHNKDEIKRISELPETGCIVTEIIQ